MWELAICCALFGDYQETTAKSLTEANYQVVDDLARQYRIQVYNTFRTERPTYDRWAEAGFKVLEYSNLVSTQSPHQAGFAKWFREAREATLANGLLPTTPDFDPSSIAVGKPSETVPVNVIVKPQVDDVVDPDLTTESLESDPSPAKSSLPWGSVGKFFQGVTESEASFLTDEASDATEEATNGDAEFESDAEVDAAIHGELSPDEDSSESQDTPLSDS